METNLGLRVHGQAVVITTGTFMRGLLHVGLQNQAGGRMGDSFSTLSDSLRELGFEVTEKIGKTGLVAIYKNGDGPTIAEAQLSR